ncbi:glycine--tRNA ligase [Candidatus Woesearchaeota archaeon]|nr:glycine--tRNA ligase [Candidatus Woesearchaeota archaeon]
MNKQENILNIATKRGFFYPSAEYYGSKAGFWTYGHLGKLMKTKFENLWRCIFLGLNDNYYEIEGSSILPKKVFESSGHLKNFNDPLTECEKCHFRFRADQLVEDELKKDVDGLDEKALTKIIRDNKLKCPRCGSNLMDVKWFNMMFELRLGATGEDIGYLSPETAQNPYLSFKRQFMAQREKLPMGLAMVGKAFRNEISPRQGFFRLREFTQAELQIFFDPDEIDKADRWNEIKNYKLRLFLAKDRKQNKLTEIICDDANKKLKLPKLYVYHLARMQKFYLENLEIPKEKFRFRELAENERAFYNKIHFDGEINMETLGGFKEVCGCHYRTDHDLLGHSKGSGEKLEILYDNKRFVPHVLELSFGVDRNLWALLDLFYNEEKERTSLRLPYVVAPIETAVFPLVNKDKLPEKAEQIYSELRQNHVKVFYDSSGSIGRMYRRMDEIGCLYMVTIDHQTLKDNTVTVRNRNDMKQIRVKTKDLLETLRKLFKKEIEFKKAGKLI